MTHPDPIIPQPPPLTLCYLGKPVRVVQHHGHYCLLADDILQLFGPRLRRSLQQQLPPQLGCTISLSPQDTPQTGWPAATLQRALRHSKRPAARRLRLWLERQALPALQQRPDCYASWEQALAMAAEAGQQISHAVLQAVLQHGPGWQRSHWLLTLNYSPDHPRRHAHGRLVELDSQASPLQALAQRIAGPDGLDCNHAELLRLASACYQQLAKRMEKQAWRVEAQQQRGRAAAA
ncbi:hypothetical protein [Aquitalea sp. USM4]|uniref:hypothetical protein n=2 Tax=Aquitalea TaxID=407217 RepID=UPI001038F4A3|nr:hypothetical protein [Aquitalea sp. USM4]QBJ79943.1 hypothetical protein DKK66_18855 [Aquitalea sp. USM4]